MKKYINTSNYYLSTITSKIEVSPNSGTFDILDVTVDWVTLPEKWYYWVDVDFWDVSKREIFRIKERNWYTLTYDKRISPYWKKEHSIWATVALRDFSELLNSLSTNTDNFWEVEITWDLSVLVRGWNIYLPWNTHAENGKVYVDDKPFTFDTNTTSKNTNHTNILNQNFFSPSNHFDDKSSNKHLPSAHFSQYIADKFFNG